MPFLLAWEPILDLARSFTRIGLVPMLMKVGVRCPFVNGALRKNKIIFCEPSNVKVSWQNESAMPHFSRLVLHCGKGV